MADIELWLHVVAGIGAIYDIIRLGAEHGPALARRLSSADTRRDADQLAVKFSTYSDEELNELLRRIEQCRRRFMAEGSGSDRARCLCHVLRDIRDGNGGTMPLQDWDDMYHRLRCEA